MYFQAEKSSSSHQMSKLFEKELKKAQKEDSVQSEDSEEMQKQDYRIAREKSILPKGNSDILLKEHIN